MTAIGSTGSIAIANRGRINAIEISGGGQNTIENAGRINNGIALSGNGGTNAITNHVGGRINQAIVSFGGSADSVDNAGLITNRVHLDAGDDTVINRGDEARINGEINQGDGADHFVMLGGRVSNEVLQAAGDDRAELAGGVITQRVGTGAGDDELLWTGGRIGALEMDTGDDLATFTGLTDEQLAPGVDIDAGSGDDRLQWRNTAAGVVRRYLGRESFELTEGSALTFPSHGTLTLGDSDFDAYSLGGYWTRTDSAGWYLDGVAQATWYDVTMTADRGLNPGETEGWGLAASLEGGYPFALRGGWALEPQGQLVYQGFDFDDLDDGAAEVHYSDLDSLAGRIGARLARTWEAAPGPMAAWARLNLWHEFLGQPRTEFSAQGGAVAFTAEPNESWLEVGLGGDLSLDAASSLYGNASYQAAFDSAASAYDVEIGVKFRW